MLLRALGHDEYWLQDRLAADPELLGLGHVRVLGQEVSQTAGGFLDLLVERDDTYFSVEVQLGGVDASHGFRALEYWARNQRRWPDKRHIAVVVAEQMRNRYGLALEMLTEYLPLVVIELRAEAMGDSEVCLTPKIVAAHSDLGLEVFPVSGTLYDRTPMSWQEDATQPAWDALTRLVQFIDERLGVAYIDYSASTYIAVRRGRRLWARIRLTETGIALNLPDPDGGRVLGAPTAAFEAMREAAAQVGVPMQWQPSSSSGAHPVNVRLRAGDLAEGGQLDWVLHACWEAFEDVEAFTDRYWQPSRLQETFWEDDRGFEPYYTVEYHEVGYGGAHGRSSLIFWSSVDETQDLWSVADDAWDDDEFARRVLLHHTEKEPTKRLIRKFLAGPAREWELGGSWSLDAGELTAWLHEWRD